MSGTDDILLYNLKRFVVLSTEYHCLNELVLREVESRLGHIQVIPNRELGFYELRYRSTRLLYVYDREKFFEPVSRRRKRGAPTDYPPQLQLQPQCTRHVLVIESPQQLDLGPEWEIYSPERFRICPLDHAAQPQRLERIDPSVDPRFLELSCQHGFLSSEITEGVLRTMIRSLPVLSAADPVALWLGFRKGDVILEEAFELDTPIRRDFRRVE